MAFMNLFRPKWRHSNWRVREVAVNSLDDPSILAEIIRTDCCTAVRLCAIHRISDQEILLQIIRESNPAGEKMLVRHEFDQYIKYSRESEEWKICEAAISRLTDRRSIQNVLFEFASTHPQLDIREAAASLLSDRKMAGTMLAAIDVERALRGEGGHAWDKVASLGEVAVEPLLDALRRHNSHAILSTMISDHRPQVVSIVKTLGRIGDRRAIGLLGEIYHKVMGNIRDKNVGFNHDVDIPGAIAEAVMAIGDPVAVEPFLIWVKKTKTIRSESAKVLERFGSAKAVETLMWVVRERRDDFNDSALWALHNILNPDAVSTLVKGLDDPDNRVSEACADSLAALCREPLKSRFTLTFETKQRIQTMKIHCMTCQGRGYFDLTEDQIYYGRDATCSRCAGQGYYQHVFQ